MFRPLTLFDRNRNAPSLRSAEADPYLQFHREMNRLFDDFFAEFDTPSLFNSDTAPDARSIHMEVTEKEDAFEIEAELPGVNEKDIHVELADNLLTIRGEKTVEKTENGDGGALQRAYSSFQRSMSLPFDVDPDKVDAAFKNGVLTLTLPKPPALEAKTRKISVRSG